MLRYSKGARAERELVSVLRGKGFITIRAAGSGMDSLSPDIIAIKKSKVYAFECKYWNKSELTIEKEKAAFLESMEKEGIEVYVAWRIPRREWYLIKLSELSSGSKHCSISMNRVLKTNRRLASIIGDNDGGEHGRAEEAQDAA